jgi:8-oxo-dGTP diphosphatase
MIDRIDVVSAVIIESGRVLLTQRAASGSYALTWETPGGKVEPGEEPVSAVRRELLEELCVHSVKDRFIATLNVDSLTSTRAYRIHFFFVRLGGVPVLRAASGIGWFALDELDSLRMTPGTRAAFGLISNALREYAVPV